MTKKTKQVIEGIKSAAFGILKIADAITDKNCKEIQMSIKYRRPMKMNLRTKKLFQTGPVTTSISIEDSRNVGKELR
jgi:hypothetical protein